MQSEIVPHKDAQHNLKEDLYEEEVKEIWLCSSVWFYHFLLIVLTFGECDFHA